MQIDANNLDEHPSIVRKGVQDIREDITLQSNTKALEEQNVFKCKVKNCFRDITYNTLEELVEHANEVHPNYKLQKFNCKYCTKCCKMFVIANG